MTQPIAGWETYVDPMGQGWPAPAAAPAAGFTPVPQIDPTVRPVQPVPGSEQYSGDSYRPAGTLPGVGADAPAPAAPEILGAAERKAAAGGVQAPEIQGAADRAPAQPSMVPVTSTDTSTTTTGVDKAGAAAIRGATGQANDAATAAGQAKIDQEKAGGYLDQQQAQAAYGRGVNTYFEQAAAMQVQDDIIQEVSRRRQETAKFKPDRTALFKGDTGTLFGIAAAVSAMAGGWLMGQGITKTNVYLDSVMRMIDDNANDQAEANSLVYQELTQRLGSAEAARHEMKARMLGAVNDTIEAQSRFEKGALVQKGAAGTMAQVQAEIAKNNLDAEKLVAKNVSTQVQRKTQMVPNIAATGGIDVTDPKEYAKVGKIQHVANFAADVESLAQTGELADSVGLFDEGFNYVADSLRVRSPSAAKVDALKAKWELMMRSDWASEPNGQETQRRLSTIGFPRSDKEIPLFRQNVREALNSADPGGRYRIAARAMGNVPKAVETGRTPIVRGK